MGGKEARNNLSTVASRKRFSSLRKEGTACTNKKAWKRRFLA